MIPYSEDTEARALHKRRDEQAALLKASLGAPIPMRIPLESASLELHKAIDRAVRAGEVVPFRKNTPAAPVQRPKPAPAQPLRPAARKIENAEMTKIVALRTRPGDALLQAIARRR